MKLTRKHTNRGFEIIEFKDYYGAKCNIQKSSLATKDAIWIGLESASPKIMASKVYDGGTGWIDYYIEEDVHISTRMHLTQEEVKKLLPILHRFVDTGEI